MTLINDKDLLQKATSGDKEAFGLIYDQYIERIYNYIYYRTGNTADAEDLTAQVFFKAYNHIGNYQDRGVPFSAWLYRIAHNMVANWHRDTSKHPEVALEETFHSGVRAEYPELVLLQGEEKSVLLQAIHRLPAERQQLVILKFVEHLSNQEIGEIMGRTEGAIKSLYHRTLSSLRKDLKTEFHFDPEMD